MKFTDFITLERCIPELKSTDKIGVIREILEVFGFGRKKFKETYDLILAREAKGTTGLGEGIAIPHTGESNVDAIMGACARSTKGVEFDSLDGEPVHLIFMVLSSEEQREEHVACLKYISRKMRNVLYKNFLLDAKGKRGIYKTLREIDEKE